MTAANESSASVAFDREKWQADLEIRRLQVALQEREVAIKEADQRLRRDEIELKRIELQASTWRSPLVLAILAAVVAAAGNAVVAYWNGKEQVNLEHLKAEQARILEMIKTGDREGASNNLRFLLQAGLISDASTAENLKKFLDSATEETGPVLPAPLVTSAFDDGSPEGSATTPEGRALNVLKNRAAFPNESDFDKSITLQKLLQPGPDESRFDSTKAATLTGTVVRVKISGPSSANFESTDPERRDIIIYLALTRDAPPKQQVIAVVTPRIRRQMAAKGIEWSPQALLELRGRMVTMSGWLFFNRVHLRLAENTNPSGDHNFRATCWELHPVTNLQQVGP